MKSKTKSQNKPLIILTAGGTGGHIYPAEALADELGKSNYRLMFVTDSRGQNNYHGKLAEIPNIAVLSGGVMGKSSWTKVKNLFKTGIGTMQAMWLILKHRPTCVVGFGGYASFPCCMAAILLGTELVIHEQNSVMSRTNRFLAKHADLVALSFSQTKYAPRVDKTVLTGMPIRQIISDLYGHPYPKSDKEFELLVLGGSQGTKVFSEVVPSAIEILDDNLQKRLHITQQCRLDDIESVRDRYKKTFCSIELAPFFSNVPELYSKTNLIISRAGASSVCEIAAANIPSILIPLPTAADDHQTTNAAEFAKTESGIVISQDKLSALELSQTLKELINNHSRLEEMSKNTQKFAITDAASRLAKQIEQRIISKK